MTTYKPHCYLDVDGVFGDFDAHAIALFGDNPPADLRDPAVQDVMWAMIRQIPDFFVTMPVKPDAQRLYDGVKHMRHSFLTGASPKYPDIRPQKAMWLNAHFPEVPVTMCRSKEKCFFARPGDILIDDWLRYRQNWEDQGGIFIHHTSAEKTLAELSERFPEWFGQAVELAY